MNNKLTVKNLYAQTIKGKEILKGLNFSIDQGEIHAIMGPNGGGKSTFAQVLMGHPGYVVTKGQIKLNNKDITTLKPDERAKLGLFLGFQYPIEVAGVNFGNFLRTAINEQKKAKEKKLSPIAFRNQIEPVAKQIGFNEEIVKRSLNEGFSGGEKKKAEILQLAALKPKFAVLDEPDSGLDVDSLRHISVAINKLDFSLGLVLITHYQRILHYIKPQFVHVIAGGKIVKSGGSSLAQKIEEEGYKKFI